MSYHVLSGRFAFFFGAQKPDGTGLPAGSASDSVWQPAANSANPTYSVLLLELDRGRVGATGVKDATHFEARVGAAAGAGTLGDQRIVIMANWEPGPTPGSLIPTGGGHIYCEPSMDKGARSALQNILFGGTTSNIFYLFNSMSQAFVEQADVKFLRRGANITAGNKITDLLADDIINISGVGTLTIP